FGRTAGTGRASLHGITERRPRAMTITLADTAPAFDTTLKPRGMERLNDLRLLREFAFIEGKWCGGDRQIAVTNPSTGELVGHVPDLGAADTRGAIAAAQRALPGWTALLPQQRAQTLRSWFDLIEA